MDDHWIYSDFKPKVDCFRTFLERELSLVPEKLLPLANYYLKERLLILNDDSIIYDPRVGRPVPYLVLWFSNAMGLSTERNVNQLALSLCYISIIVSIRDDLVDGRVVLDRGCANEHAYIALTNYFYDKYYGIFRKILPEQSIFWSILAESSNQWAKYETWSFLIERKTIFHPLSSSFLKKSSSYLVAITLPSIAAIAILCKEHSRIANIRNFLKNYCMGWKIADDLRDWRKDLNMLNYNHSTVICNAINLLKSDKKLDTKLMESIFLNKVFIVSIYKTLLQHYSNAKKDVASFKSGYLDEFIDSQEEFYSDERDSLLSAKDMITRSLSIVLNR